MKMLNLIIVVWEDPLPLTLVDGGVNGAKAPLFVFLLPSAEADGNRLLLLARFRSLFP